MSESKEYKRRTMAQALREAAKHLAKAGEALASAADTLSRLQAAKKALAYAEEVAAPTRVGLALTGQVVKTKKDALPKRIRNRARKLNEWTQALIAEVEAVPVNKEERLLQQAGKKQAKTPSNNSMKGA